MTIEIIPTIIEIGTLGVLSFSLWVQKMHYDETYKYRREFDTAAIDAYRQRQAIINNTEHKEQLPFDLQKIKEEVVRDAEPGKEFLGMKPLFEFSEVENNKIEHDDRGRDENENNTDKDI